VTELRKRAKRGGGIVRGLAARRDFEAKAGPQNGYTAGKSRYPGFGDAKESVDSKDSDAHHNGNCTLLARMAVLKKKEFLGLFCKFDRVHRPRL
jgi:hypothetical protein